MTAVSRDSGHDAEASATPPPSLPRTLLKSYLLLTGSPARRDPRPRRRDGHAWSLGGDGPLKGVFLRGAGHDDPARRLPSWRDSPVNHHDRPTATANYYRESHRAVRQRTGRPGGLNLPPDPATSSSPAVGSWTCPTEPSATCRPAGTRRTARPGADKVLVVHRPLAGLHPALRQATDLTRLPGLVQLVPTSKLLQLTAPCCVA